MIHVITRTCFIKKNHTTNNIKFLHVFSDMKKIMKQVPVTTGL